MMKLTLSLDHQCHKRSIVFDRYLTYPVPDGWAAVLFDSNNDYYSPLDVFPTQAEADVWSRTALQDGIYIS